MYVIHRERESSGELSRADLRPELGGEVAIVHKGLEVSEHVFEARLARRLLRQQLRDAPRNPREEGAAYEGFRGSGVRS